MKRSLLVVSALSALAMSNTFAATTAPGGTVRFTGEIVDATCAVSTETANQTVTLGQYRTQKLKAAGDRGNSTPFQIKLVDCNPTAATKASVAFAGRAMAGTGNTKLLAVSGATANDPAATNVGIEISDSSSTALGLSGTDFSVAKDVNAGTNTLDFAATYVATGASTAGVANAEATFVIKYE